MVESALCCFNKRKVISRNIIQHLTSDKPRDTNVQGWIHDYHGSLEYALGSDSFGTSLDVYKLFINDNEEGTTKGDPDEEEL